MLNEKSAQFISTISVWILMGAVLIYIGLMIENVNQTVYPWATSLILAYMTVGHLVMKHKEINPNSSKVILMGKPDHKWAIHYWYWACWWPLYLNKSGKCK